jgi:chemotaxis protein MotB
MARKKRRPPQRASIDYMLTYGDMLTLLLCFFVMLLTMSTFDVAKVRVMLSAFRGAFGVVEMGPSLTKEKLMTMGMEVEKLSLEGIPGIVTGRQAAEGRRIKPIGNKIQQALREEMKKGAIRLRYDERGVIIQLTDKVVFDTGSAEIKLSSRPILDKVADLIKGLPNKVCIEGHTDNIPIRGGKYRSNWELSAHRAISVLYYLEKRHNIPSERLSAIGYGPYRPIASNETEEGRALNRRVDVVILREELMEEGLVE